MKVPVRRSSPAGAVYVGDLRYLGDTVSCVVRIASLRYPLTISAPGTSLRPAADAFVPFALIPALVLGAPVEIDGPVSTSTLDAAGQVQQQFAEWFPTLQPVPIRSRTRAVNGAAPGVLSLFSGGVDSFYTALQRRQELTHLLFAHGFDIPLSAHGLRRRVASGLRAAAADLGIPLIEVETNVRDMFEDYMVWDFAHGAAIAGVTMALSERIGRVVIPSTYTREDRFPWGSHPDLDPRWSTREQEFEHDAPDVTRFDKTRALVASETAIRHLRVCWKNPDGVYNCGRCEKCLRTMATLRILGHSAAPAFPPLDLRLAATAPLTANNVPHWQEIVLAARAAGDTALAAAAAMAVARRERTSRHVRWRDALGRIPGARLVASLLRR